MRQKTKNGIIATVAVVCAGVAGFAIAGGFNNQEVRDYTKNDSGYSQQVGQIKYSMTSNVEGYSYDLPDPVVIGDTYYFTLEAPENIEKTSDNVYDVFNFSHFTANAGKLSCINVQNKTFQLEVQSKDLSTLKITAVFVKQVNLKTENV